MLVSQNVEITWKIHALSGVEVPVVVVACVVYVAVSANPLVISFHIYCLLINFYLRAVRVCSASYGNRIFCIYMTGVVFGDQIRRYRHEKAVI